MLLSIQIVPEAVSKSQQFGFFAIEVFDNIPSADRFHFYRPDASAVHGFQRFLRVQLIHQAGDLLATDSSRQSHAGHRGWILGVYVLKLLSLESGFWGLDFGCNNKANDPVWFLNGLAYLHKRANNLANIG